VPYLVLLELISSTPRHSTVGNLFCALPWHYRTQICFGVVGSVGGTSFEGKGTNIKNNSGYVIHPLLFSFLFFSFLFEKTAIQEEGKSKPIEGSTTAID